MEKDDCEFPSPLNPPSPIFLFFFYFTALGVWVFFFENWKTKPGTFNLKHFLKSPLIFSFPFHESSWKMEEGKKTANFFYKPADIFMKHNWLSPPDPMEYFEDNKSFLIIQQRHEQVPDHLFPTLSLHKLSLTWTSSNTGSRGGEHRLCQNWVVSLTNHCIT